MICSRDVRCAAPVRAQAEDFDMSDNGKQIAMNMAEKYIDKDHREIKGLSMKWWDRQPQDPDECMEYAILQYRSKDFERAKELFLPLAQQGYADASYRYADCLYHHPKTADETRMAEVFYTHFLEQTADTTEPVLLYERGMCYAYGLGTGEQPLKAFELLEAVCDRVPEAAYELGCAYTDGTLGRQKNFDLARQYLIDAYEHYVGKAIFALYELYGGNWEQFPYQRELTEAYSYRLGKYMRVAHVNPSLQSLQNLADIYLHGFPGDTGEDDARFKRKAQKYLKRIEKLREQAAE